MNKEAEQKANEWRVPTVSLEISDSYKAYLESVDFGRKMFEREVRNMGIPINRQEVKNIIKNK
jgi:hypothetical protein